MLPTGTIGPGSMTTSHASYEDRLKQEIVDSFKRCGFRELDQLDIEIDAHGVTLRGVLPTYFLYRTHLRWCYTIRQLPPCMRKSR